MYRIIIVRGSSAAFASSCAVEDAVGVESVSKGARSEEKDWFWMDEGVSVGERTAACLLFSSSDEDW